MPKIFYLEAGDSTPEELASVTQVQGPVFPIVREKPSAEFVKVTEEMKSFSAYSKLRVERTNKRHLGARLKSRGLLRLRRKKRNKLQGLID